MKRIIIALILIVIPLQSVLAQHSLTLEECRQMAVSGNHELEQARLQVQMADYDKKTAFANYFPSISANGTYTYNSRNVSLVSKENQDRISNMGTTLQGEMNNIMAQMSQAIQNNPAAALEYMLSPMWKTVIGSLSQVDLSAALNAVGAEVSNAFNLDIANVFAGAVSLQQPVFVGGKIIASNKMAALAKDLSEAQYDGKYQEILVNVDQAYWQIVSISGKKKLADNYVDLLETMLHDVEIAQQEGVAVQSDVLSVKVKYNEAKMMQTKATSGLVLSKMLLCRQIGLPLDSQITLADENTEFMVQPQLVAAKSLDAILAARPETRSLDLASKIYDQKVKIARADMMPKIAATANYLLSNPNCYNGFRNEFGGMFNVGVMVSVPIFHGTEALQRTRKAKTEAKLFRSRYEDACNMINLQVQQLTCQQDEAIEKFVMSESNLKNAEENLRMAVVGFEEGVVNSNTALAAHTAWLQAHSEYIDAGVEMQMNHINLLKAQGEIKTMK